MYSYLVYPTLSAVCTGNLKTHLKRHHHVDMIQSMTTGSHVIPAAAADQSQSKILINLRKHLDVAAAQGAALPSGANAAPAASVVSGGRDTITVVSELPRELQLLQQQQQQQQQHTAQLQLLPNT